MRKSSKLILVAGAIAALAVPSAAMTDTPQLGSATNKTTKDAVGWAVSNGNTWQFAWGTTTGADRSQRKGDTDALMT